MPTLWVFGDSLSLPYHLDDETQGWPYLLSKSLGMSLENFAKPAADNFYIYYCYQSNLDKIKDDDLIVIGWSHPSRKSFVLDRSNPSHLDIVDSSFVFPGKNIDFIRSNNKLNDTKTKMLNLRPKNTGKKFYDTWFENYYSDKEQKINFQSYIDSTLYTSPCTMLHFFFSKESVVDINASGIGHMLDFIIENDLYLNENDMHPNLQGHREWASIIKDHYVV